MPKSKEYVSSSEDSSEEETKPRKKQKRESDEKDKQLQKAKKQKREVKEDSEPIWDLGCNRQVTIRDFKGKTYVDIREMYYDKDGDLKPGRKGICLSMQQWHKFMSVVEEVNQVAKSKC